MKKRLIYLESNKINLQKKVSHQMDGFSAIKDQLLEKTGWLYRFSYSIFQKKRPSIIFILGHMRSGSTLMLHLLASHPDITAWGEQGCTYRSEVDLWKLILKINLKAGRWVRRSSKFYVDQVNQDYLIPNPDVLKTKDIYTIFLIRPPDEMISSMYRIYKKFDTENSKGSFQLEKYIRYYIQRMSYLQKVYHSLKEGNQTVTCTYRDLTWYPERTLMKIQQMLNLKMPLYTHYKIFPFTGKKGDSSDLIKSGQIMINEQPLTNIPKPLLDQAYIAYEMAANTLQL